MVSEKEIEKGKKNKNRNGPLRGKDWERGFTVEEHRVSEYVELYESIGYEVRVEAATPDEQEVEPDVHVPRQKLFVNPPQRQQGEWQVNQPFRARPARMPRVENRTQPHHAHDQDHDFVGLNGLHQTTRDPDETIDSL